MTAGRERLLRQAYAAYSRQDLETLAAMVTDDVDWPVGADPADGRLHGRDAVRAFWVQQWTRTRTHDEPVGFEARADGRMAVTIDQVVRSTAGTELSRGRFVHVHRFDGDRIARMDIAGGGEVPAQPSGRSGSLPSQPRA